MTVIISSGLGNQVPAALGKPFTCPDTSCSQLGRATVWGRQINEFPQVLFLSTILSPKETVGCLVLRLFIIMRLWVSHKGQRAVFQRPSSLNYHGQGLAKDKTAEQSSQSSILPSSCGREAGVGVEGRGEQVGFLTEHSSYKIQTQICAPFFHAQNT